MEIYKKAFKAIFDLFEKEWNRPNMLLFIKSVQCQTHSFDLLCNISDLVLSISFVIVNGIGHFI